MDTARPPRLLTLAFALLLAAAARAAEPAGQSRKASPAGTVAVVFVGDVMLDNGPGHAVASGRDPFAACADLLLDADFTIGNLECVLGTRGTMIPKAYSFRAAKDAPRFLRRYFTAVSLGNNHAFDFGAEGLVEMLDILDRETIGRFGAGRTLAEAREPFVLEKDGLRIAILGANGFRPDNYAATAASPGVAPLARAALLDDIAAARKRADVVVPFVHWGDELVAGPLESDRGFAREMIDAGAAAVIGGDDIAETTAHPHHEPDEPPVPPGSDSWTLQDVSVDVPAGSSLAVVGATGSGKSTIARLLVRLADPQLGRVLLGGVDLRDVADDELRHRVQLVPQEPFLFDGTIRDNLDQARPGGGTPDPAAAARTIGLADWMGSLPEGLETRVGERGGGLSAGERQLVALLRAELTGPDVLVLDEATSALDAESESQIDRALRRRGCACIVVAHRLSTVRDADEILVLEDGEVVGRGRHEELVRSCPTYAEIVASQQSVEVPA